ncbi:MULTISPECIES: response regulator [Floridanema]|uniref:Response regulator n=2 Tax=Floridanema TaxID=3396149 RepID=A0ABV4YI67_9CYAN
MANDNIPKQILKGFRVLIVEDDPDTRDLYNIIFEEVGAEIITVTFASEALDIIESYEVDIVISNITLPDGDGCLLVREIKARLAQRGKNISAIAVTGATGDDARIRSLAAGFQKHLSKPVDIDDLVKVVANLTEPR